MNTLILLGIIGLVVWAIVSRFQARLEELRPGSHSGPGRQGPVEGRVRRAAKMRGLPCA
jgi:hypothetical protein